MSENGNLCFTSWYTNLKLDQETIHSFCPLSGFKQEIISESDIILSMIIVVLFALKFK